MDYKELLAAYLARMGCNALVNARKGCGCHASDLMPCEVGSPVKEGCMPALAVPCPHCGERVYVAAEGVHAEWL